MNAAAPSDRALVLLAPLRDPRKTVRRAAAHALESAAGNDVHVRNTLYAGLASAERRTRFACAFALARAGASTAAPRVLNALCEAIDASDPDERWAAASAIVRLGRKAGARARLVKLARTAAPRTRRMALYCLRGIEGPHPCGLGAEAARDGDAHVRLAALAMIAVRGDGCSRCAACALDRLLRDRSAGVRRAAAAALGKIGVGSAAIVDALRRAAEYPDSGLARAARGSLERLVRA
jgi:HEAT repeat protein